MPIYEYQCGACGHQLEAFQKMSDAPLKDCPVCNKPELQKLVSAAGFQLKGTGWYATDFRNKGKSDKPDSQGSGEGSTGKSEGSGESSTGKSNTKPNSDSTTGSST